jgi:putative spermidine/putrescine transport system permease protein
MTERELGVLRWFALFVGLLLIAPLVVMLLASLNNGFTIFLPPRDWGLRWYSEAVRNDFLVEAFTFSMMTAAVSAAFAVVLGVAAGFAIARYEFPGRGLLHALVMTPLLIPTVVVAIGILQLFSSLGIPISPEGLVAGHTAASLPFVTRLTLAGIGAIDPRLESAALSLGASRWRMYRTVVYPQIRPAVLSGLILAFLLSLEETTIAIFTSSPGATTLPVQLLRYYSNRSDPLVAAASSILLVITVVVAYALDRMFGLLKLLSGNDTTVK